MRKLNGWAGFRTAAITLAVYVATGVVAQADSIKSFVTYNTVGNIDNSQGVTSSGLTGSATVAPIVSFDSVTSGSFTAPSAFSLGSFHVGELNAGVSTTYNNTPFSITLTINKINGSTPLPNQTPVTLTGKLNGTISDASQSDVVATFDKASLDKFQTGNYLNTLSVLDSSVSLVPSTTNNGQTTAQAKLFVEAAPVPEPASIAVFLVAIGGGFGLWRRNKGVGQA